MMMVVGGGGGCVVVKGVSGGWLWRRCIFEIVISL